MPDFMILQEHTAMSRLLVCNTQQSRAKSSRPRNRRRLIPSLEGMEERQLMTALPRGFVQVVVARKLIEPTGMAVVPDGRLFVTQQTGQVRVVKNSRLLPAP